MASTSTEPAAARGRTVWAWAVATVGGAGLLGPAPGTNGSAVAALGWWLIAPHLGPVDPRLALGVLTLLATAIGVPAATRVAREAGKTDPGCVVIDEVAGQWLTLVFVPAGWKAVLAGFILFRVFDMVKPFPVRRLERFRGGWGIVLDDLGAGVYGMAALALLVHFRVLG